MMVMVMVMVVVVVVGRMSQEGVDRHDDRTMTMTRTMSTVVVIAMRRMEAEAGDDVGGDVGRSCDTMWWW